MAEQVTRRPYVREVSRTRWFRPTYATAHEMQQYLNAFTQRANGSGHVHTLVMMFHSNEIYPGTSRNNFV